MCECKIGYGDAILKMLVAQLRYNRPVVTKGARLGRYLGGSAEDRSELATNSHKSDHSAWAHEMSGRATPRLRSLT